MPTYSLQAENHENGKPVILFDGYCNLCNSWVQWVIEHDSKEQFHFASLSSDYAKQVLPPHLQNNIDSIVLVMEGDIYVKSTAALKILKELKTPYRIFIFLMIIPPLLRDPVYDVIAKYRYKWFGKRNTCMNPTEALKARFHE